MRKGFKHGLEDSKSKIDTAASEDNRKRGNSNDSSLSNRRISTCLEKMGKVHRNRKSMAKYNTQEAYRFEDCVSEVSAGAIDGGLADSTSSLGGACRLR